MTVPETAKGVFFVVTNAKGDVVYSTKAIDLQNTSTATEVDWSSRSAQLKLVNRWCRCHRWWW
ncbi:hypothetical protein [Rhodospirillum rubrum]|uniref:hypothetical protein n=1 Tax=Rhodospirillum rubrum TaxID=1085 RepID=UPI001F5B8502|nr:hypothetical protein [Rhodospirillum rubrum]